MPQSTRKYMALYVEVFTEGSDDETREATVRALATAALHTPSGRRIGMVDHVQVTSGPKSVLQERQETRDAS